MEVQVEKAGEVPQFLVAKDLVQVPLAVNWDTRGRGSKTDARILFNHGVMRPGEVYYALQNLIFCILMELDLGVGCENVRDTSASLEFRNSRK